MKRLLLALLLVSYHAATAQNTDQIKQELEKIKKSVSTIESALKPTEPEQPGKDSCKRGPKPEDVLSITQSGATVLFDGDGVFGWDYTISQNGTVKANGNSGKDSLSKNKVDIFFNLDPGTYTLSLQGNTCASKVYTRTFVIPKTTGDGGDNGGTSPPPPISDAKYTYQIIMGTTGSGFDPNAKYGIKEGEFVEGQYREGWLDRIEATKFSWGYGISGIALWVGWNTYEPKPGQYQEEAFKRVIQFCKERNLSLSVVFMRRRDQGDGFIREDEIITGSNGTKYIEGVPGYGSVYAGYANTRVNALSAGAIKSIARLMATYDKSFYIALAGGGAGEQVNYVYQGKEYREAADFSDDNLRRFDAWRTPRGIATQPGRPPMIQGSWNDWPHPDFNNPLGLEFARFTTYGIKSAFDSFAEAVRSQTNKLTVTYFYSVTSNLQFRSIANPNINWIAEKADGVYGSDGDGISDQLAKFKVNSLNLGTFPNKVSMAEEDVEDVTMYKANTGQKPPYCVGGIYYDVFENTTRSLFSRGLMVMNLAMSWCTTELKGAEGAFKSLRSDYVGHEYKWPNVNSSNTVTVDVTDKYRQSIDLMDEVKNVKDKYVKYTSPTFFGGVSPEIGDGGGNPAPNPSKDYSPVKSILDANLVNYNWAYIFDLKSASGTLYSTQIGQYGKDSRLKIMSHSKFTTGVIISYLIDQGKLSLDTKVGDIIKTWNKPDRANITIRQIMGHMSGIPDDQSNEGADKLEDYVNWLSNVPLKFTPGATFSYSSVSYQVAARMAEIVTGKSWKDLFREILVEPCEMGGAEYNPKTGDIPGKPLNPLAGYGLQCTEAEWMNFISMIRDGGVFKGRRVLSANVFEILKTRTSPGWSDWGVGVMFTDGQFISEAASGCFTFIKPGSYAGTIFTQADYEHTYGSNHQVRKKVLEVYQQ